MRDPRRVQDARAPEICLDAVEKPDPAAEKDRYKMQDDLVEEAFSKCLPDAGRAHDADVFLAGNIDRLFDRVRIPLVTKV